MVLDHTAGVGSTAGALGKQRVGPGLGPRGGQEPSSKDLTSTTLSKDLAELTYKGHHIARLQKISSLL
jgi:hypothetical protein